MDIKILLKAIPYEFQRAIISSINKKLKRRPSSAPFLSGDTYRKLADALYDGTHKCKPEEIFTDSVVFVSSTLLDEFCKAILPNVSEKFILFTHQGDVNITNTHDNREIADNPLIIHWFAQNCTLEHTKVTPLPIGLEDAWRYNAGCLPDFKKLNKKIKKNSLHKSARLPKIVVAFTMGTNPNARFDCYRALWHKPITAEFPGYLNCRQYRKELSKYMFVASPAGNGLDCHRTWEAMYFGVIPIVEDNYMHRYFKSLGLPLWIISDWKEVANMTEKQLINKYNGIIKVSNLDALWIDYWKKRIDK